MSNSHLFDPLPFSAPPVPRPSAHRHKNPQRGRRGGMNKAKVVAGGVTRQECHPVTRDNLMDIVTFGGSQGARTRWFHGVPPSPRVYCFLSLSAIPAKAERYEKNGLSSAVSLYSGAHTVSNGVREESLKVAAIMPLSFSDCSGWYLCSLIF